MKSLNITTHSDHSAEQATSVLTESLKSLYGSDLTFPVRADRPYVIGNFVQTLDGVASYNILGRSGGGPIAGFSEEDRFIMGLLRTYADAVMVGSGTLHGDPGHVRIPRFIYPDAEKLFAAFRGEVLKKQLAQPLNVIVSGSGNVDLTEATFHTPDLRTLIITTGAGERQLKKDHGESLSITQLRVVSDERAVPPRSILNVLYEEFGVRLLLHEGGPRLFGEFLAEGLLDELFLTVAPQVAGREATSRRPGFAEGAAFLPETAPWFRIVSLKQARSHLFLRLAVERDKGRPRG